MTILKNNKINQTWIKVLTAMVTACYIVMVTTPIVFAAGSFSVSGGGSVSAGGTKTITISASNCAGKFTITASNGGKVSSSALFLDNGSDTVTVTAPTSGSTTITVTAADVTDYDGNGVSGSKTATVSVAVENNTSSNSSGSSSNTTTPVTPAAPVDTRSSNCNLSALKVGEGDISPEFAAATKDYTLSVKDISTISISGTAADSKATVSGTGTKDIKSGENKFSIVVTAENGTKKTYTITVNLEISPSIYVDFSGSSYGVVVDTSTVSGPAGFEESTTIIGEEEVQSWYNPNCNLEVVYFENEAGKKAFYIVEEGTITSTFRSIALLGQNLFVVDISEEEQNREGLTFEEVEIDGKTLKGWSYEDEALSDYKLIRLMNQDGTMIDYLYFAPMTSMIEYDIEKFSNIQALEEVGIEVVNLTTEKDDLSAELSTMKMIALVMSVLAGILAIISTVGCMKAKGNKSSYNKLKNLIEHSSVAAGGRNIEDDEVDTESEDGDGEFQESYVETFQETYEENSQQVYDQSAQQNCEANYQQAYEQDLEGEYYNEYAPIDNQQFAQEKELEYQEKFEDLDDDLGEDFDENDIIEL